MLELKDFEEAKKRVDEVIIPTPLIYSPAFSKECRNMVYIKPENLQRTGAFKIRGAYNKIMKMDEESKSRGLIASSAGNHAQGVAYAAQQLGVKATIVMPAHTPLIKVDATKALGADVVLHGEVYDDAYNKAKEKDDGLPKIRIHDFRHSHASFLINNMAGAGFSDFDIAKRLGDTVETLHNTYAHWFDTKDKSIVDMMNKLL